MGGVVVPRVAERMTVRRLSCLAAVLPIPGRSLADQRAAEPIDPPTPPTTSEWSAAGEDVWTIGPATATEIFYHDASPELAAWASARLRPQSYRFMSEPSPLGAWPAVDGRYVVCRDDQAVNPVWARAAARDRLGVEAVEIDGGHSPFLTRPAELAAVLERLID
jgi:hypothetical protein